MIKFDIKAEEAKLKELMSFKRTPKEMTKEGYKTAVINNLPKADNPEVRDFNNFLGFDNPAKTPAEGLEKKQRGIEKNIDRKENSMREFAIKRDAAMFAVAEVGIPRHCSSSIKTNFMEELDTTELLKKAHEKWLEYFNKIY